MTSRDIRAVENPISAIFDLAEDVNREAPRIRKLVTYASVFIVLWLIGEIPLMIVALRESFLVGVVLIILFVVGILALGLLSELRDFFRYYVMRHSVIVSVRSDDPVLYAPEGNTPIERLSKFLSSRNPPLGDSLGGRPLMPQRIRGASGVYYSFDGYFVGRPGILWRALGVGYPGYQIFVKAFDQKPKAEDFMFLKHAVEDVSQSTKVPPSRVIALWTRKPDDDLSEDAYAAVTSQAAVFSRGRKHFACSLELIVENEDRSYEFIPYIVEGLHFPVPRAQ
jgi:hypothetical protein